MKKHFIWSLLTVCLLFGGGCMGQTQGYTFSYAIGGGFLDSPQGLAYDSSGNLYVASGATNRVQKFAPDGTLLLSIGAGYNGVPGFITMSGNGNGQFYYPVSVAVDTSGNIYVSDLYNNRIQKFDSSGTFLLKFGSSGTMPGQFNGVGGLALDHSGNLYAADANNNRVQKFSSSGTFLMGFGAGYNGIAGNIGASGLASGQFNNPNGVTLDSADNIYVADGNNNRIQKLNPEGQFLLGFGAGYNGVPGAIGSLGSAPGDLFVPNGVAVDSNGNVYAYSGQTAPVQVYDSNGHPTLGIGKGIFGSFGFGGAYSIALDGQGHLAVPTGTVGQVFIVDTLGHYVSQLNFYTGKANGQFISPRGIAVDSIGNIYVVDRSGQRFQKFDKNGNFLQSLGALPTILNSFYMGVYLWADKNGHLYVADITNSRILKFDTNGNYLSVIGIPGSKNGQFGGVGGIVTDEAGNLYAVDPGNNRIQKFDLDGYFLSGIGAGYNGVTGTIGQSGSSHGQFNKPSTIALDSTGNLYVADNGNNRIQKFDRNGNYLLSFRSPVSVTGGFANVLGLAVDSNGSIFAAGAPSNAITKYDKNGQLLLTIGTFGIGVGQFDGLSSFTMDSAGNLYATETGINRTQVLIPTDNLSGSITLDSVPDLAAIQVPLDPVTVLFRTPGSKTTLFTLLATLTPEAADRSKGDFVLKGLPPGTYDLAFKSPHSLQVVLHSVVVGGNVSLPNLLLHFGDANKDNLVDIGDFGLLVNAYSGDVTLPGSGYDPATDFNFDGRNDIGDFGILVNNYGTTGDP